MTCVIHKAFFKIYRRNVNGFFGVKRKTHLVKNVSKKSFSFFATILHQSKCLLGINHNDIE